MIAERAAPGNENAQKIAIAADMAVDLRYLVTARTQTAIADRVASRMTLRDLPYNAHCMKYHNPNDLGKWADRGFVSGVIDNAAGSYGY